MCSIFPGAIFLIQIQPMIVMGKKLEYLVFYLFTIWTSPVQSSPEVKFPPLLYLTLCHK